MDWGIPDWRSEDNYRESDSWNRNRWRWEFLRRRADLREEFEEKAETVYQEKVALFAAIPQASPDGRVTRPDQPGFFVSSRAIGKGVQKLPNPKIGDQPDHAIAWTDWPEGRQQFYAETPPGGFLRFDFDLHQPIKPQLLAAEKELKEYQKDAAGKLLQRRERPDKWLIYLRVLDARVESATWSQIAKILHRTTGSDQAARDSWDQARALCFNF